MHGSSPVQPGRSFRETVKIVIGLESLGSPLAQSVLTVGNFDGVHRAHQQLLAQTGLFAANTGGPVVVLTFEPHPLAIVAPDRVPPRLTTLDERLQYLDDAGADMVVVARSDPELLGIEAEVFVEKILIEKFRPTHIVEGPTFGFGRGRKGTSELLQATARPLGCEVHILEPVRMQIGPGESPLVSSSLIRNLLKEGKARRAALCLGRPYSLTGTVIEGNRRGRELGFPTANLHVEDKLIPGDSVYAGRAWVDDIPLPAAISIGVNPTFGAGQRTIEAHLLEFNQDLYGATLRLEFHRRLRHPQTFSSTSELTAQLTRDVRAVRESLRIAPQPLPPISGAR